MVLNAFDPACSLGQAAATDDRRQRSAAVAQGAIASARQLFGKCLLALIAALALTVAFAGPATAHEEHRRQQQQAAEAAARAQGGEAKSASPAGAMHENMEDVMTGGRDRSQMSFLARLLDWFGRTHPFLVHFPIAFFPAALFTAVVGRRRPAFGKPVQFLVVTGGLVAPVAALFGWINAGWTISGTDWVMTLHAWLGTAIGIVGLGLAIWAWRKPETDRRLGMILSLGVMTVAILAQGWLGGAMIHGMGHLNW